MTLHSPNIPTTLRTKKVFRVAEIVGVKRACGGTGT